MSHLIARVGIVQVQDIDDDMQVRMKMFELLDLLQDRIQIPASARVVIKVNLCLLLDCETGATVDPRLVRYLSEWLLERYSIKEIIIAESDATALNADRAYYGLGWDCILAGLPKTRYLNLTKDEKVSVKLDGFFFEGIRNVQDLYGSRLFDFLWQTKDTLHTGHVWDHEKSVWRTA